MSIGRDKGDIDDAGDKKGKSLELNSWIDKSLWTSFLWYSLSFFWCSLSPLPFYTPMIPTMYIPHFSSSLSVALSHSRQNLKSLCVPPLPHHPFPGHTTNLIQSVSQQVMLALLPKCIHSPAAKNRTTIGSTIPLLSIYPRTQNQSREG